MTVPFLHAGLWWSVAVAAVALLAIDVVAIAWSALVAGRRKRSAGAPDTAERSALAGSRFTIPVSLITWIDGDDSEPGIRNQESGVRSQERLAAGIDSVRSLLALDYPQFEVIVVSDSTRSRTIEALKREYELTSRQMFYRRSLPGRDVRMIYGSSRDDRLLVVDHEATQPAEAWNCAVNLARYRYLGIVAADRVVARDALLTAMVPATADPAAVVAILGHLGARHSTAGSDGSAQDERSVASSFLEGFRRLQRLRDETGGRAAPADFGPTAASPGAFGLWRRDAVLEAGGFAPATAGEGLDLALRVRQAARRQQADCRILLMPETEQRPSRETVGSFIATQARCYHAMLESAWRSRGRVAAPGGLRALSAAAWHVVPGLLEAWLLVALPLGVLLGAFGWLPAVTLAATVSLANATVTNTALLQQDRGGTERPTPLGPICLGAVEFALHRPLAAAAAALGSYEFLTGASANIGRARL